MVINACEQFAERTARWMLSGKMDKIEAAKRLRLFSDDHVVMIGQKVKEIKAS